MRILMIAPYAFYENSKGKKFTGLDYVVSEIAEYIGEKETVDFFCIRKMPKEAKLTNCNLIKYSYFDLIRCFKIKNIRTIVSILFYKNSCLKEKVKNIRSVLTFNFIDKYIKTNRPNCIHIHSAAFHTQINGLLGVNNDIPLIYTLHGLNFSLKIGEWPKKIEREFIKKVINNKILCTVVSTGIKEQIECVANGKIDSLKVVLNAISFKETEQEFNYTEFAEKLGINSQNKVFICVGSLSKRKNQIQLLRSFCLLPEQNKKNIKILLLGKDDTNGSIDQFIMNNNLKTNIINCGFINKQELAHYYKIADYNIVLSRSEGFGLSIIESMFYGLPTLVFSDLNAIQDLYDSRSMLLIEGTEDTDVKEAILNMVKIKWDSNYIKETAKKFDKSIYDEYINLYKESSKYAGLLIEKDIQDILGVSF